MYDGDVKSSIEMNYSKVINNHSVSPLFIIESFNYIYKESFKIVFKKSKEISIPFDLSKLDLDGDKILSLIDDLEIKPLYIFCSDKSKSRFGIIKNNTGPFPPYFYNIKKIYNKNYDLYYSPLIEEDDNEVVLYVTDSSFQSLVYTIQNMEYNIENDGKEKNHTLKFPFYECDFNSYKISIKDISKIRNEKIENILS